MLKQVFFAYLNINIIVCYYYYSLSQLYLYGRSISYAGQGFISGSPVYQVIGHAHAHVIIFGVEGYFLALRHVVGNIPFEGKHLGIIYGISLHPVKKFPNNRKIWLYTVIVYNGQSIDVDAESL